MSLFAGGKPVISIEAEGVPVLTVTKALGNILWSSTGSGLVSPDHVNGFGRSNSSITVSTPLVTATGGSAYVWTQLSGDADWSITNPTGAQTAFVHANTAPFAPVYTATFKVTIDGGQTATVTASARNVSGL